MILGGKAIYKAFTNQWRAQRNGKCMSKDALFDAIGPNSFDVTLASAIMFQGRARIDPENAKHLYAHSVMGDNFWLRPGDFILGVTQERFNTIEPLPIAVWREQYVKEFDKVIHENTKFVQKYDGRSTMGRLGVASHVTAGFGDYGFGDYWTLEIVNLGGVPVRLFPGMRIGQISFEAVYEPSEYKGAYVSISDMPTPKPPVLGKDRF